MGEDFGSLSHGLLMVFFLYQDLKLVGVLFQNPRRLPCLEVLPTPMKLEHLISVLFNASLAFFCVLPSYLRQNGCNDAGAFSFCVSNFDT